MRRRSDGIHPVGGQTSPGKIGAGFGAPFYRRLTRDILQLFPDNGSTSMV